MNEIVIIIGGIIGISIISRTISSIDKMITKSSEDVQNLIEKIDEAWVKKFEDFKESNSNNHWETHKLIKEIKK